MKKRIISILLVATLILGCFTVTSFGATTTKTMTTYSEVIKSGKYAYCAAGSYIYRVNVNTKSKKRIAKVSAYVTDMKMYKGYIYFKGAHNTGTYLYRVKKTGKYLKKIAPSVEDYAISGSRIYYRVYVDRYDDVNDVDRSYTTVRSMKLNGTNKRSAKSYKVKEIYKRTNTKGYRITSRYNEDDGKFTFYLKFPSGKKVFLRKQFMS